MTPKDIVLKLGVFVSLACLCLVFGPSAKADNVSVVSAVTPITGGSSQLICVPACGAGQETLTPGLVISATTEPESFAVGQYTQNVSGSATAADGALKAGAFNTITCSGDCFSTSLSANPGITKVGIQTDAEWGPDLSLIGTGGATAVLNFDLDGTLSATPGTSTVEDEYSVLANIIQGSFNNPNNSFGVAKGTSNISGTLSIDLTPPDPTQAFTADLYLFADAFTEFAADDPLLTGGSSESVNLLDTMQFTGSEVLDANGNVISGATVNFLDGNPLATPEPSGLTLLSIGLLGLCVMAFWRKASTTSSALI